jgi:hypothetical protein
MTRGARTKPTGSTTGKYPITRSFAVVIIAALIILVIIRHLFGGIDIRAGIK